MTPRQEDQRSHRAKPAARAIGAAAAIAPLLAAGAHADQAQAKTFKVKNTKSHGKGTLNKAIKRANRHNGFDRVIFRSRLSGDIKVRRGKKRNLAVTDPLKIAGPGRKRLTLRGPAKGSALEFVDSGKSVLRGLKLKAIRVDTNGDNKTTKLRITNSKLSGKGIDAIGVSTYESDVRISRSTIRGFNLGVSAYQYSNVDIDRSLIADNKSGGGAAATDTAGLDITKSTISNNQAEGGNGGGVFAGYYGGARISDSTITGNSATVDPDRSGTGEGGGVWGNVAVTGSTITGNIADQGGGIHAAYIFGPDEISGSIIAGNTAATDPDCSSLYDYSDEGGAFKSDGQNVFGPDGCYGAAKSTDILTANAGLKPLGDNGGPTPTIALRKGSPAIDHAPGLELPKDQRGVRRDKTPDSGSFELR